MLSSLSRVESMWMPLVMISHDFASSDVCEPAQVHRNAVQNHFHVHRDQFFFRNDVHHHNVTVVHQCASPLSCAFSFFPASEDRQYLRRGFVTLNHRFVAYHEAFGDVSFSRGSK